MAQRSGPKLNPSLETKSNPSPAAASANPTALFGRNLQGHIFDQLLEENKGDLQALLEDIKARPDAIKEAMKNAFYPQLMQRLVQAVIDDDMRTVKTILDFEPQFLLSEPADFGVSEIESQKTWQSFKTEKVLVMAQKRSQVEMTKVLLPYFDKLPKQGDMKSGDKSELEKQWILPPAPENKEDQKQWEEKQKQRDEALQKEYTHGSTLRSNLYLISVDDEKEFTTDEFKKRLKDAEEKRTPILIRHKNKFQIYGDPEGDGKWRLTDIKQDPDNDLNKLPFEKGIIRRDDKLFTASLIKTVKSSHAHASINFMELIRTIAADNEAKVTWAENKATQLEEATVAYGEKQNK